MSRHKSLLGLLALLAVLFALAVWLQRIREASFPLASVSDEELYLTSEQTARHMAVAHQALAADLYWIRAIQYYGGTKRRLGSEPQTAAPDASPRQYGLLYPLLDLTTALDPLFNIAYRFGAIFLAEPYPAGPGRPDLAIALLEKGLRVRPDRWDYMQDVGFVHYWWRHDYDAAAQWFRRASGVPGAPWWLRTLAATVLAEGGDRSSSRLMWQSIRQSTDNEWVRHEAERRLMQLDALGQIDALQQQVEDFIARNGRLPTRWNTPPRDPSGTPYELENGRVRLSRASPLFPLPTEPAARPQP